jgi:hypothetical protein
MMVLALLAVLLDSVVPVQPSSWRAIEVRVDKPGTTVECSYSVDGDVARVEAILVTRHDAERFNQGRSYHPLASTGFQTAGKLRSEIDEPGDYILLLDNRLESGRATDVSLKINLRDPPSVVAGTVSPERRQVVITLSLLFFLGVVMFSARQFMK